MDIQLMTRKLHQTWRRFCAERSGNVVLIFGLALIPIVGLAGAAIDYSRGSSARTDMQAAIDAAGIMLSKDIQANPNLSQDQLNTKAQDYFLNNFTNRDSTINRSDITAVKNSNANGQSVTVSVSGTIQAKFMPVLGTGIHTMNIGTNTTIAWGSKKIRVALALDTTGSMSQGTPSSKISALQTAIAGTGGLIDMLSALNISAGDVYISIAPFAMSVTTDPNNYTHDEWIDWTDWDAPPLAAPGPADGPGTSCPWTTTTNGYTCMTKLSTLSGASNVSTIPSSGTWSGYICPSIPAKAYLPRSYRPYNGCYNSVLDTSVPPAWQQTGSSASCGSHPNCSCTGSGASKVCKQTGWRHDWRPSATSAAPDHSTWGGCLMDRGPSLYAGQAAPGTTAGHDEDTSAASSGAGNAQTRYAADQYSSSSSSYTAECPAQMRALNNDWTAMKTYVNGLTIGGGTNQNVGLVWAWQSLVGGGPLTAPAKDPGSQYESYIILLSDGLNTGDRWYCDGVYRTTGTCSEAAGSTDGIAYIDGRMSTTCQNIKNASTSTDPITIYTVQVNTGTDPHSTVLQNCATRPNATASQQATFYYLTQSGDIPSTFKQIATEINKMHIAH